MSQAIVACAGGTVGLSGNIVVSDIEANPAAASGGFSCSSDGSMSYTAGSGPANWFRPTTASIGNQYWCKLTIVGSAVSTGTTGSVLALSSTRTWTWNASAGQSKIGTGTLEIFADAGGATLLASCSLTYDVEST
jgi:hypothetical protein